MNCALYKLALPSWQMKHDELCFDQNPLDQDDDLFPKSSKFK